MDLGFGHLLKLIGYVHADVKPAVVQARLKYFARLKPPFPSPSRIVGGGARADYSAEDLMKLMAAFELLAAGIAPLQAAGLARVGWPALSLALARAWGSRGERTEPALVLVRVVGLESKRGGMGTLHVGRETDLRIWAQNSTEVDRRLTVIDARQVANVLDRAIRETLAPPDARRVEELVDVWMNRRLAEDARATGT